MLIPDVVAILCQVKGLDQMMLKSNMVVFTEIESVHVEWINLKGSRCWTFHENDVLYHKKKDILVIIVMLEIMNKQLNPAITDLPVMEIRL